ncbi:M23 family metallopeptidase [uncultured Rikenella sp.]|uniref:murein hydrolase activator EnvC family protein n=1 Tax=uncultured Rikenella sp. TaxID=368003 RepID=UPI00263280F9|nr:M23 family metallopeptidase [uncultured Rikenella sp.]
MRFREIVGYLRERNKLSLRNVRTGQEIWHVFVSRINMVLAVVALLLILFVAVLTTVAYTPVLDLIPGYPGSRSREALIANIMKLDSLSAEVSRWEEYHTNFAKILDGQVPLSETDTLRRQGVKGTVSSRIGLDSVLRGQMTDDNSPYRLSEENNARTRAEVTFEMLPPVKGIIAKPFSPKTGMYGVEIAPAPNQVVLAVLDGTVILDTWNPETGNIVAIQHGGNMVTIYKQVAKVLKTTGERIRAGEAVAVTGQLTDSKIPHMTFELWYNGTAVDPENYIVF